MRVLQQFRKKNRYGINTESTEPGTKGLLH